MNTNEPINPDQPESGNSSRSYELQGSETGAVRGSEALQPPRSIWLSGCLFSARCVEACGFWREVEPHGPFRCRSRRPYHRSGC